MLIVDYLDVLHPGLIIGKKLGPSEYELIHHRYHTRSVEFSRRARPKSTVFISDIRMFAAFIPQQNNRFETVHRNYRSVQHFLAPFRLGKKIGEGGNGTVHNIRGLKNQVVKIIEGRNREEIEMNQRLFGHCARMLDYGLVKGAKNYVVLRLKKMRYHIADILTPATVQQFTKKLTHRMREVAKRGYIGFDQKPSNIMLDHRKRLYLIDMDFYEYAPRLHHKEREMIMLVLFGVFIDCRYHGEPFESLWQHVSKYLVKFPRKTREFVYNLLFGKISTYIHKFRHYYWNRGVCRSKKITELFAQDNGMPLVWVRCESEHHWEEVYPTLLLLLQTLCRRLLSLSIVPCSV